MKTMKKTAGWLVMAAALTMGMTACSSADGLAEEPVPQPENPAKKTYTMTVTATKGGDDALARAMAGVTDPTPSPSPTWEGSSVEVSPTWEGSIAGSPVAWSSADDGAAAPLPSRGGAGVGSVTRALSYDSGTKTLNALWTEGELVTVYTAAEISDGVYVQGPSQICTLQATNVSNDGMSCTLTGDIDPTDLSQGQKLYLQYRGGDKTGTVAPEQDGTLQTIADFYDRAYAVVTIQSIGDATVTTDDAVFANQQAIVRFTLQDKSGNAVTPSSVTIEQTVGDVATSNTLSGSAFDAAYSAGGCFYYAFSQNTATGYNGDIEITATTADGYTYTYTKEDVTFTAGKFYSITVKMERQPYRDLSAVKTDITLQDGDVLTDIPDGSYNISIADGATVTLYEAYLRDWRGITCLGDATIVLSGENVVTSTDYKKAAIQAGPEGTTLTITGTGTLTAESYGEGAAIGSGSEGTCGDIIITGGTVTATSSSEGAAIGSSQGGTCGDIIITGGTVTATSYGSGAGIGSGSCGDCGKIIISGGSVTATGGHYAPGIGNGREGSCEAIYITDGVTRVEADNFDEDDEWHSRYPSIGLPDESVVLIGCWYDTESGDYGDGTVYWHSEYDNDGEEYLNQHPLIYEP